MSSDTRSGTSPGHLKGQQPSLGANNEAGEPHMTFLL
jgi:hypothetical protein